MTTPVVKRPGGRGPPLSRCRSCRDAGEVGELPRGHPLTGRVREGWYVNLVVRAGPAVRCRRSRDDLPREREVGDAAGGGDRLDVVGVLECLHAVPDALAAS